MAARGCYVLWTAREKANLSREQVAERIDRSVSTLKRWEHGESKPESAEVAILGEVLGDNTLWPRWMCAVDDEYAHRHPYTPPDESPVNAVVRLGLEAADMRRMIEPILSDLMDGKIDDETFKDQFITAIKESESAHRAALESLQKGGS